MIETFNSMEVFEFLLCVLIILALLLEAISFWKTNKQSESILKVKSMDKNNGQNCTLGLNTTKKFKNSLIYV